jgi:hypothetical protein
VGDTKQDAVAVLRDALTKLRNETRGFLNMADPVTHGHTNIYVLQDRIRIADEALQATATAPDEAQPAPRISADDNEPLCACPDCRKPWPQTGIAAALMHGPPAPLKQTVVEYGQAYEIWTEGGPAPAADAEPSLEVLDVPSSSGMDSITVFWRNYQPGKGSVTITCYGSAWTAYFGAMSGQTIQQFFASADTGYLVNKLGITPELKQRKRDHEYLGRIIDAVKAAMRAESEGR